MTGRARVLGLRVARLGALVVTLCAWNAPCAEPEAPGDRYLDAARSFAVAVHEHGRDVYGEEKTPLFVDGLHATTLEPVRWLREGDSWILSNLASQAPLFRLLDGLSALSGEKRYAKAAEDAAAHALRGLVSPSGLLYWGGHTAWDLEDEKPVGQYGHEIHEMNHILRRRKRVLGTMILRQKVR